MSSQYQEANLSAGAQDLHRALASLQEELEAVDWYNQRIDTTSNVELAAVLEHNRNEEIEHASMILEWIRRTTPEFDETLGTYLFKDAPITQLENAAEAAGGERPEPAAPATTTLGIGKLR
jgi:ferritin-like protein